MMLLIFTGQVFASSIVSCSMQESAVDTMLDHSSHDMPYSSHGVKTDSHSMKHESSSSHDCCSDSGNCSMAGCFLLALPVILQLQDSDFIQQSVISEFLMAPSQLSSSLYRPPILS